MTIQPRPDIEALHGYSPGRSQALVARETGRQHIIKLASNESLWGPSERARQAAEDMLAAVYRYPEVQPPELLEALAERHGIDPRQIIVGNGADEILRLVAQAYVAPGQSVLYPQPGFSAYGFAATLVSGTGIPVPLTPDGRNDLTRTLDAIRPDTRLIYLCSPNNPTGGSITQAEWEAFLHQLPDGVLVVVDGAYWEFLDQPDVPDILGAIQSGYPVLMARTFSKLYALAGLRIGWAISTPDIIHTLQKVRDPFSLNLVGAAAAVGALGDSAYYEDVRHQTLAARAHFMDQLARRHIVPFPSQANFVTFPVPEPAETVAQKLEYQGFIVRPTTNFGLPGHIRVTMAPPAVLDQFWLAWDTIHPAT
ncbi:histidinol-phosphate aminotransferase [Sulfobacillus acidophilus TPY]|uniref:Histidinol-phosphate aminotransferase n=1 Tax=Sulfobacillus acidophilus (strain ATCC 700253 / DSM 10332 / NAL) TaxID=679936 RepID=G8TXY5_SULAD|nr:histidinol-phosphate aminotransferase [Sulfobacillus acidophilus TPY]AEW06191.1 Histidinol-phosphate aminotransferase [Sulfobacillus acidophilus DSM 10332]